MSEPSTTPLRWIAALATAVLALIAIVTLVGRPDEARPDLGPAPPCPVGFVDRPVRGEQLLTALRRAPAAAEVVAAAEERDLRYCFGAIERPVISASRVLLLSDDMAEPALAARLGHLLHHAAYGGPFPDHIAADADCDAVVDEALAAEARAYALEVTLREAFELEPSRFEFEPAARRLERAGRTRLIERYLRAHPDGARNLDPLGSGYRQRCEAARAEAR